MKSISPYQLPLFSEKQCTRCGAFKLVDDFGINPHRPPHRLAWCRSCQRSYQRDWCARNKERLSALRVADQAKQCKRCALSKSIDAFVADWRYKDGYRPWCRTCLNDYANEWYGRNKDRLAARPPQRVPEEKRCPACGLMKPAADFHLDRQRAGLLKAWCKECHARGEAQRRARDPERYNEAVRRYRRANPEAYRASARRYQQAHPEKVSAYLKQWRRNNREWIAQYIATHREEAKAHAHKRRALLRGGGGTHTKEDLDRILSAQQGLCAYCGVVLTKPIHVDHKVPVSRGGSNAPENLCLSCPSCNNHKHTKTDVEYRAWLAAHPR